MCDDRPTPEEFAAFDAALATLRADLKADRDELIVALTWRRTELALSQAEVARRTGTTQSAISDFENHRVDPRLDSLQRWARALGLRLVLTLSTPASAGAPEAPPKEDLQNRIGEENRG